MRQSTGKMLPILLLILCVSTGNAEQVTEHAVKAAIVHKITKFVSWPSGNSADNELMRFCVAGNGPMLAELAKLQNHSVRGKSLTVRSISSPDNVAGSCDVLYLGNGYVDRTEDWLAKVSDSPVLTIGETEAIGDAQNVVIIGIRENKVRFAINLEASEKAGLTIGAQLLQLAAMTSRR